MKLMIRWKDGDFMGEVTMDVELEDGDVIDLTAIPKVAPGNYIGNLDTGELVDAGRPN